MNSYFFKVGATRSRMLSLYFLLFWLQGIALANPITPLRPYMIFVMLFGWLLFINHRGVLRFRSFEIMGFIFFAYMMFSSLWGDDIKLSLLKLFGIIFLLLSYFCLYLLAVRLNFYVFLRSLILSLNIALLLGLLYYFYGISKLHEVPVEYAIEVQDRLFFGVYREGVLVRMRGLLDSPNNHAIVLLLHIILVAEYKPKYYRLIVGVAFSSLLLTLSVTGVFSLAVYLTFRALFNKEVKLIFAIILSLGVCSAVILYIVPYDALVDMASARLDRVSTGSGRFGLFAGVFELFSDAPLIGHGLNQARILLADEFGLQSTHNSFLEAFLDGGVIGFALFVLFWLFLIFESLRYYFKRRVLAPFGIGISLFVFSNGNLLSYVELFWVSVFIIAILVRLGGEGCSIEKTDKLSATT